MMKRFYTFIRTGHAPLFKNDSAICLNNNNNNNNSVMASVRGQSSTGANGNYIRTTEVCGRRDSLIIGYAVRVRRTNKIALVVPEELNGTKLICNQVFQTRIRMRHGGNSVNRRVRASRFPTSPKFQFTDFPAPPMNIPEFINLLTIFVANNIFPKIVIFR